MKNFILLFVCLFTMGVRADYGAVGKSANKKFDGTVENPDKIYINVKNQNANAISAGMLAVWDVSNDDGASVTISNTRTSAPACIMVATCASGAFCKCQTYGYYSAALFDDDINDVAASASGKFYISGQNAGYISARAPLSTDQIGSISAGGYFYDTPSVSAAVEVFIKLR